VLAVGVPARDAVFDFRGAVKVEFLGALDCPVLEDAVAAIADVALDGGLVWSSGLIAAGDDAGVGAETFNAAQLLGWAEFAGNAGGEDEADAGQAGKQGVGGGGEHAGGLGAEIECIAFQAAVEFDQTC